MNKIEDSVIKYAIDFERYKNGQANEVTDMIDNANRTIAKYIRQTDSVYTKARYKEIVKKLNEVSKALKEKVGDNIDIDGVIEYELKKQKKILNEAKPYLPKVKGGEINFLYPSLEQIKTAALFKPVDTKYGLTYQSYLEGIENGLYNIWDSAIRTGYLTGQSTQKIVSNVLGGITPQTKMIKQGMINSYRNAVYANTRTVLQSFANETMNRVYEENEKYFGGKEDYKYEYLATLDNRTCLVCGANDAKLYKSISEVPQLPLHRNCRCVICPYINVEGEERASKDGYTEKKTFNDWLQEQKESVKKDVLGATRYQRLQEGIESDVGGFVNDGKVLTLPELELKEKAEIIERIKIENDWFNSVPKDLVNNFTEDLKRIELNQLNLIQQYTKDVKINFESNEEAEFIKKEKKINMNLRKQDYRAQAMNFKTNMTCFLHETAHAIDFFKNGKNYYSLGTLRNLEELGKQDLLDYVNAKYFRKNRISSFDKLLTNSDAKKNILKELSDENKHLKNGVSDIISGITRNKIQGKYYHDTEYWNESKGENVILEIVANSLEAIGCGGEKIQLLKLYFPSIIKKIFERF